MIALGIIALTGLYFMGLGLTSLLAPARAARFLSSFASSGRTHYLELMVRLVVGWALLSRAPFLPFSNVVKILGWVLIITTMGLLLVPWPWHHRFAKVAVPRALRYLPLIGGVSLFSGILMLVTVVQSAG